MKEVKSNEEAFAILEGKEKKYIEVIQSLEKKVEKLRVETSPNQTVLWKPKHHYILGIQIYQFLAEFVYGTFGPGWAKKSIIVTYSLKVWSLFG